MAAVPPWKAIGAQPNEDAQLALGQTYGQLLNGWLEFLTGGANPQTQGATPTDPGYLLEDVRVWLKGQVRAGAMGSAIFRLPPYCTPSGPRLISTVGVTSAGALIPVALEITPALSGQNPGADVVARGAANVRLALDGSFVIV